MSGSKRRCATCRYFQDGVMGGAGWCTHPKRQESSDVRILVRPAELACRNAWGVDFWEARDAETAANVPQDDHASDTLVIPDVSYDDEVTEVISADLHRSSAGDGDRVVEQRAITPDDDYNDDDEAFDRFDLLARGGRDAVAEARRRAMRRRTGVDERDEPAEKQPDEEPRQRPSFEPDDFIETESPSPQASVAPEDHEPAADDDRVISEGTSGQINPRSRRLRRARGATPDPKDGPVETAGADRNQPVATSNSASVVSPGPFDSIPEVSGDLDISRFFRDEPSTAEAEERFDDPPVPASPGNGRSGTNFDEAIKRAQAIKAAARAEREARLRDTRRPITPPLRLEHAQDAPAQERDEQPARARISTRDLDGDRQDGESVLPGDEMPLAAVDASDDEFPEPVRRDDARRSWWRGMFAERRQAEPRVEPVYSEPDREDRSPSPAGMADDPVYLDETSFEDDGFEAWDDDGAAHWDTHAEEDNDPAHDETWIAAQADDMYAEDEETFDDGQDSAMAASPDPYSPIDLDDEHGLETFRSRLFASARPAAGHTPPTGRRNPEQPAPGPQARTLTTRDDDHVPHARWAEGFRERREAGARAPRHREPDVDPASLLEHPEDAWYEPEEDSRVDLREMAGRPRDLLDMTIRIFPEVPQQCSTCRNYRQAEHGERGWCTNNYAFTHRQMVNADDLACKSTIGCWWLPADVEVWLDDEPAEVAATPRVDRLLAHLEPVRRASGR